MIGISARSVSVCRSPPIRSAAAAQLSPRLFFLSTVPAPVISQLNSQLKKTIQTSLTQEIRRPSVSSHRTPFIFQLKSQSTSSHKMSGKLQVGDQIPSGTFKYIPYSPELASPTVCGNPIELKTDEWKGKKIVLFGVPGAFTKTCSNNHLPGYIEKIGQLKSKGVSGVYCIASNDAFVMSGWGRLYGSNEHVEMISDSTLQWLEATGLTVDLSAHGLGKRGTRFALVIDDLKVTYLGIEESPGGVSVSGADAVLAKL